VLAYFDANIQGQQQDDMIQCVYCMTLATNCMITGKFTNNDSKATRQGFTTAVYTPPIHSTATYFRDLWVVG